MAAATKPPSVCVAGRYILEDQLGEGGMGKVYRARHATLEKRFALKVIAKAFADDGIARARFVKEAHLASQISHPGIASVIDFGEDRAVGAFMVMELVHGAPVVEPTGGPAPIRKALDVAAQVAELLDHIHANGIIHGDVKLDNLLLVGENDGPRRRQTVKLLDFGLAERIGSRPAHVGGTPEYVAPERVEGGPPTVATDIYALGILLFRLLAGVYPFQGSVEEVLQAQLDHQPPSISGLRGEPVDDAIETLVRRALAKSPHDRHGSASAFGYELNAVMDMLAMTRRRTRSGMLNDQSRRDAMVGVLFEKSSFPQAVLQVNGDISIANEALGQLVSIDSKLLEGTPVTKTVLATALPGLVQTLRKVYETGKPAERRARVESGGLPIELVVWIAPFAAETLHLLIRVDELNGR
jgi:serine/threonine-protein kinase